VKEIRKVDPTTGAEKCSKLERHDLIPAPSLRRLATHFGVGASKYAEHNWRRGYAWSWSFAAMMRHAWAFWNGEDIDEETGSRHLTSTIWHAMALDTFMDEHPEKDDRFVGKKVSNLNYSDLLESITGYSVPPGQDEFEFWSEYAKVQSGPLEHIQKCLAELYYSSGENDFASDMLEALTGTKVSHKDRPGMGLADKRQNHWRDWANANGYVYEISF